MSQAMQAALGPLVLILALSGCADVTARSSSTATSPATAPMSTAAQLECERTGGVWRDTLCERSGGGGY